MTLKISWQGKERTISGPEAAVLVSEYKSKKVRYDVSLRPFYQDPNDTLVVQFANSRMEFLKREAVNDWKNRLGAIGLLVSTGFLGLGKEVEADIFWEPTIPLKLLRLTK